MALKLTNLGACNLSGVTDSFELVDDGVTNCHPVCDRYFRKRLQGGGNFAHNDGQLAYGQSECLGHVHVPLDALQDTVTLQHVMG